VQEAVDLLQEPVAVPEAGQAVAARPLPEPVLAGLPVGDVLRDQHAGHDRARAVAHRYDAMQVVAVAVRQLEGRLPSFERGPVGRLEHGPGLFRKGLAYGPALDLANAAADPA
jgi:hypothetical protein